MPQHQNKIGMIGLGLMGTEIAARLSNVGHYVVGWDISAPRRDALERMGVAIAPDCQAVFDQCDPIILSLPTHEVVSELLGSIRLKAGSTLIDTTTGSSESAEKIASSLRAQGVEYLDATVSGSSVQLASGSAVMLVGASPSAFEASRGLLETLCAAAYYVGLPGAGARMKLVTNLVLGLNRAALAEGLAFASSQGLDMELTLNMLRKSMSYSRIMDTKGEKMVVRDFTPQARLSQHLKDVRLMLESAEQNGIALPLSETHRQLLQQAEQLGLGELDNSALIEVYRRQGS